MHKIKMLVFDVDGTLYDLKEHKIPESAIKGIQQAKENGYLFVIASGRCHYGLGKALNDLNPDYILSVSGGVVVDHDHNIISASNFKTEDVDALVDFAKKHESGFVVKCLDHMYIYQYPEKIDWYEGQVNSDIGPEPFIMEPTCSIHKTHEVQAACLHADPKLIKESFRNLPHISFLQYSEDGFDVVLSSTNKGAGLLRLMEYLNISKNEVACFGDNYNDLEMMDVAGTRIAMGNAIDEIKEKADYITTASNDDGIYNGLKYLGCI